MELPDDQSRPAASIVVPVWNNVAYTHACLVRLAGATPAGTYEVVLVDNGSTDATPELLAGLSGDVRVVRNDQNLGFARACNQGAEVARGRYLVFLNNDTEPHPGWLEPLIEVLETEPDVGVVGSKLLFPNGLVQHAGVLLVRDVGRDELHGYHRLAGSVPDDALVETRADLQAVTAAALAIRSELFAEIGGFDEAYWNGNEDVDLCLKVRAAGRRVVYEPRSTLTHHESVSGPERFSRVTENVRLLNERWGERAAPDMVGHNGVYASVPGSAGGAEGRAGGRLRRDAVHVVGPVGPHGRPGRTMALAADLLAAAGVDHDVTAYHRACPPDLPPPYSLNGTGHSCGILVVCSEPDAVASFLAERGPGFVEDRYVIAFWGWPGALVPEPRALGMAHELWIANPALHAYADSASVGISLFLPPSPDGPFASGDEIRSVTGTAEKLTFTAALDLSAGPSFYDTFDDAAIAIAAFTRTFGPEDRAHLLVGVTGGRHLPWRVQPLMDIAGDHPAVSVLDLDPAGLTGSHLAAAGDCHVALTGARGLAPAPLAAMQAGVPILALIDPANPPVVTTRNSFLLDPAAAGGTAECVALTADVMRQVAADPIGRAGRGRWAADDIARRDDRGRAVRLVGDRINRAGRLLDQLAGAARG
ncbi:MAG TPA: glycosyltransferase family 2 protein [Acidimicrobiales bacterium]|nr:glycosyltransferase family 2 protein [Acidimicrobiales bacterium]